MAGTEQFWREKCEPGRPLLAPVQIFSDNPQSLTSASVADADKEKAAAICNSLQLLVSHYGTGDDAPVNAEELQKEWGSFSVMLADHYSKAAAREVLRDPAGNKLKLVYPQLARLASLGLTIPFSTADCEPAFSTMNRIKTKLRNRLKTTTLDCLLRISIEGPELKDFDFQLALKKWSTIRNRRISTT